MRENGTVIRSNQNQYVSLVRGLSTKKNREADKLFRFDGIKLTCEAIAKGVELEMLVLREGAEKAVEEKARELYNLELCELNCRILTVSAEIFDKLTEESAPEGIISVARYQTEMHIDRDRDCKGDEYADEKILLLESVRDPQNMGAIIRVAAAFSVDRMIISRDCADIYNSKTVRASMGTVFGMKIDRYADICDAIALLRAQGRRVFAAALDRDAVKLGSFEKNASDCVIIGNEGHGMSGKAIDACDKTVFIPMAEGVESLNAATAAAVLVWEFFGTGFGR